MVHSVYRLYPGKRVCAQYLQTVQVSTNYAHCLHVCTVSTSMHSVYKYAQCLQVCTVSTCMHSVYRLYNGFSISNVYTYKYTCICRVVYVYIHAYAYISGRAGQGSAGQGSVGLGWADPHLCTSHAALRSSMCSHRKESRHEMRLRSGLEPLMHALWCSCQNRKDIVTRKRVGMESKWEQSLQTDTKQET